MLKKENAHTATPNVLRAECNEVMKMPRCFILLPPAFSLRLHDIYTDLHKRVHIAYDDLGEDKVIDLVVDLRFDGNRVGSVVDDAVDYLDCEHGECAAENEDPPESDQERGQNVNIDFQKGHAQSYRNKERTEKNRSKNPLCLVYYIHFFNISLDQVKKQRLYI